MLRIRNRKDCIEHKEKHKQMHKCKKCQREMKKRERVRERGGNKIHWLSENRKKKEKHLCRCLKNIYETQTTKDISTT